MKPIISPVPGALVFLCADGVYTEAPLYVGPFDCGFVRNPRGEGYLCLHYVGETSVPGVTYSGVWGAVLAKAKFGNHTVVTPSPQPDHPQADYPQADWSKENQGDAEEARPQPAIREALCVDSAAKIRWHLNCAAEISTQYTARPADDPEGVLAAIGRIEIHTSTIRALCHKMIGSYQKGD
jgi:hypothetical protein